jgi:hypothetical protein
MSSSGAAAGAGGGIPARAGGGVGRGRTRGGAGVLLDRFQPKFGVVVPWRSRAAAAAAASRGMPGSGELPTGARELTARSAPAEVRVGPGTVAWPRELVGTWLGCGGHGGRRWSKEQWGGAHTAGKVRVARF